MNNVYGIIDIGSNSVRLLIAEGGVSVAKTVITTRLAEGMENGVLTESAITRTADAVAFLNNKAKKEGALSVFAFATAAVRNAVNGGVFLRLVKEYCNLTVDVLSGEDEARTGFLGAITDGDGGLIDVGGASSEIIVSRGGKFVYVKSIKIGAVKIKDMCGQNKDKAAEYIKETIKEYGVVPKSSFTAIGGTATSVAAMLLRLNKYDKNKINGYTVNVEDLKTLADRLFSLTVNERKKIKGLEENRAEIIAGGALLLYYIAEKIGLKTFKVSDDDNLEGYLRDKVLKIEKEN